jgi:hypothetical protein
VYKLLRVYLLIIGVAKEGGLGMKKKIEVRGHKYIV